MGEWLLYGATGYTGRLIAERAAARGLKPVLAGRNPTAVSALADRLGLPWRAFPLEEPARLAAGIRGATAVLHCAGPFARTAPPMIAACLAERVHYLDLTGEIAVFRHAHERDAAARRAGIALLPGMGFDVVPSDCLAALLARRVPGARRLVLAFEGEGGASPGTARTALEALPRGGMIRRGGRLERVPLAWRSRYFVRDGRQRLAVTVPWGDVYTAFLSTGIPDIEVYMVLSPAALARLRRLRWLAPLLGLPPLARLLAGAVARRVRGPGPERRAASHAWLWGEVEDAEGRSRAGDAQDPERLRAHQ
ncbi:MAG: saccharopine dehydrogenase NADP-binding domain-containing protein [Xanthomonadales bacterium]|nr:saccharopine dehydrogenase NADP-binding domain-containing protein [Xanthomonadales bacterium]